MRIFSLVGSNKTELSNGFTEVIIPLYFRSLSSPPPSSLGRQHFPANFSRTLAAFAGMERHLRNMACQHGRLIDSCLCANLCRAVGKSARFPTGWQKTAPTLRGSRQHSRIRVTSATFSVCFLESLPSHLPSRCQQSRKADAARFFTSPSRPRRRP